jgi:hypothetical protein
VDVKNPVTNPSVTIPSTKAAHPLNKDCPNESSLSSCGQTDAPNLNIPHETVDLDPEEIINWIGAEHQLNGKQWVAFRIIARSFIKTHLHMSNTTEPIRILLTGPGSTGKTHVVNALRALMAMYGSKHTLCFLAPTRSAASLIDGMTIHKGLGIKIKTNQKEKGNWEPGKSSEDYTVLISVQNHTLLHDKWRLVKVLFIDEVSLLSEQLMFEIDHALRYATERPNEWFGGINVIFAGEFFQYPPICATPLYTPISDRNGCGKDNVPCHLGRLAWKTVNAVISLTKQERMRGDPKYAHAMNNLRIHQCSQQDIDLFNSCVIKLVDNPNGVDMSADDKVNSTAIVSTNLLCENINARKAHVNCQGPNSPTLITCGACNDIISGPYSSEIIRNILNMNMSKLTADGALPGFVPLYVGMPIIL